MCFTPQLLIETAKIAGNSTLPGRTLLSRVVVESTLSRALTADDDDDNEGCVEPLT